MKHQQEGAWTLMREILQEDLLELHVERYTLSESLSDDRCEIYLKVKNVTTGEVHPIEGEGVGLVDAVFQALKARLSTEYPSLNSISFTAFDVTGLMSSGSAQHSDAEVQVTFGVTNSHGTEFTFDNRSRSLAKACIEAVLEAVEYFVNSERAFIRMYKAREHYDKEGRTDLVEKYTAQLAKMVANTSYSDVIDRIKAESD
jgi:hypothetical protein